MKQRTDSSGGTRENILEAFWQCYERRPLPELSVKEIMETAGYSRSTFYLHFDGVADVLEQAEDELLERIQRIAEETVAGGLTESSLEWELERCFDECGRELKVLLGPRGDWRFMARFKNLLKPMVAAAYALSDYDERDMEMLSELISADIVSMLSYAYAHPELERAPFVHKMHAYMYSGATGFLSGPPECGKKEADAGD